MDIASTSRLPISLCSNHRLFATHRRERHRAGHQSSEAAPHWSSEGASHCTRRLTLGCQRDGQGHPTSGRTVLDSRAHSFVLLREDYGQSDNRLVEPSPAPHALEFDRYQLLQISRAATVLTSCTERELASLSGTDGQNFTPHQRSSFCVYSGPGVVALRNYLNAQAMGSDASDGSSVRRSSASSSSSVVLPGPPVSNTAASWIGVQDRRFTAERAEAAEAATRTSDRRRAQTDRTTPALSSRDPEMLTLIREFVGASMSNAASSHPPPSADPTSTNPHQPSSDSSRGRQSRID